MSVLNENTIIGASAQGGYDIPNSLRFNDDDSAYLSRTPSSAGNRKTWTWSGWVKRGNDTSTPLILFGGTNESSTSTGTVIRVVNGNFEVFQYDSGIFTFQVKGSALFRDPTSWYHFHVICDTSQATSSNRVKLYVNSEKITEFNESSYPSLNLDTYVNATTQQFIGAEKYNNTTIQQFMEGYLSEVNFIDGQALTPDDFGETGDYGEWLPKKYVGTYGTNGFYLDFKDSGSLGNDAAGSNNWTPTNLAATDQMLDSPTNNFATWNPLLNTLNTDYFQEGNLLGGSTDNWVTILSTIAASTGKWYWETSEFTGTNVFNGAIVSSVNTQQYYAPNESGSIGYKANGMLSVDGSTTLNWAATYGTTDIIGVALDLDSATRTVKFYKNNTLQGTVNLTSNFTGSTVPWITTHSSSAIANFGQDSSFAGNKTAQGNSDANGIGDFYYAPPTGFLALCTKNLPDATVVPSEHFNTVTWTGNGSTNAITGVGFKPDFTWIKQRDGAGQHGLVDSVRGRAKSLRSNATDTENTSTVSQDLISFDSDGFTVGTEQHISCNFSGATHVAWNWKAGGTGVSNTDGTITSTVSANVDAGFSIVKYTALDSDELVGHGLSKLPEAIIIKRLDAAANWVTNWTVIPTANKQLYLNLTNAVDGNNIVDVNSSTFRVAFNYAPVAVAGGEYIAYCFHSVDGYSKVGSYTGNGSADGTFVHCGFRPAYVMIKGSNLVVDWIVNDAARDIDNATGANLYPSLSDAEDSGNERFDFLANGFKLKTASGAFNGSGNTYIYLAFAESPFKHSNAR